MYFFLNREKKINFFLQWVKGTGSRDRIQVFGHKCTVLVIYNYLSWYLNSQNAPLMRCRQFLSHTRFRWKHIVDISTGFLRDPCCFLLVHCVNCRLRLVHCSSCNVLFKIAKRKFEDRRETVKFVCGPRIWHACS